MDNDPPPRDERRLSKPAGTPHPVPLNRPIGHPGSPDSGAGFGPLGAGFEIDYEPGAPPIVNDADVVDVFADAARAVVGPDAVHPTHQSLGSEDFSWYLEDLPGALVRLGCALPNREVDLHSAAFDIDEASIEAGIAIGTESMIRLLERSTG